MEFFVRGFTIACYPPAMSSLAGQLIPRERAESILQPYMDLLNKCIDEGWKAWITEYRDKHHILDARARAAIVFCEITHRARVAFSSIPNVKVVSQRGSLTIFIGDEITLRFKKIKRNGRCSNIMTKTQTLFLAQLSLPGILDGTLVHAGYALDELQREIALKAVVCQLDKQVIWRITIKGPQADLISLPPTGTPSTPQTQPRFVPKETPKKEATGEKE